MKVEYVKPFAQASYEVLKEVLDVPINRGKLALRDSPVGIHGVAIIIGITGEMEGRVLFDLSEDTALKIASTMNYETMEQMDELVRSTISELGNIIAGKAVSIINDSGLKLSITPPILICGKNMETSATAIQTIVIPLSCEMGEFNVNVAMKERKIN